MKKKESKKMWGAVIIVVLILLVFYYDWFIVLIIVFLFYIYLLIIFWNVGIRLSIIRLLIPAFVVLFYYIGILCENAKRNWFIGIRTPWTLSNNIIWEKTHKLGGKLFKLAGILAIFGFFFEQHAVFFIFIPVILIMISTIIYSYWLWQNREKKMMGK
jgi:uncharacterized membrane protein